MLRALVLFAVLVAGCSYGATTTLGGWAPQAPGWRPPEVPLTVDLPTFPPQPFRGVWGVGSSAGPPAPQADAAAVLRQLSASLSRTGDPAVPKGVTARFVGELAGGHFIYNLGRAPDRPYHESNRIYMLSRSGAGWRAVRICRHASDRVQATAEAVVCAASHGSGSMLVAAVYRGGREVFRIDGVRNGDLRADDRRLTVLYIRQWMWHKHDPFLVERVALEWTGRTYRLARHDRMNTGWPYHLARFLAFVEAGRWDRAAAHMAAPPAEGVLLYLRRRAPGIADHPERQWTSLGHFPPDYPRAYVKRVGTAGPWFWFAFAPDGRVQALGSSGVQPITAE